MLAGCMLHLAGVAGTPEGGAALADETLRDGRAYQAWLQIVRAQGGDVSVFEDPAGFHRPKAQTILRAKVSGFLADMDCKEVGWAVQELGAGRERPGEPVGAHAGIEVHAKIGDRVEPGTALFTLFSDDERRLSGALSRIEASLHFRETPVVHSPLVREIVRRS